jgi:hypothetical protein
LISAVIVHEDFQVTGTTLQDLASSVKLPLFRTEDGDATPSVRMHSMQNLAWNQSSNTEWKMTGRDEFPGHFMQSA